MGSPVFIPNFFAGMDFARITPVRLSLSPPMAEGIRRISASPFFTLFAASLYLYYIRIMYNCQGFTYNDLLI